ncbi:LPS export ABC transporter permease LptF [Pukyongiella litopenaei]|uniref:LPS export ABC transporter permease LptF n=1 Tax=Pukyongiella litopenaei TaxID=2605946 RepID=A0A2S0MUD2_9RHOB|nr:LPS export ABC transporter permease LptF [Pukyongiella litopenaei]AVO39510.1 LPS export ABC transporter permease LptF [Pukyongiella litopenaei]
MSRYDRYVLSQLLLFFGFSALILVSVFWINRAVVLFDRLIGDGQSALVFFEFTALILPNLIRMVLPMAAFAAAVWVTNRLNSESELTVMQATGSSPWRLARPALAFGLITALMMSILTHVLMPASIKQLAVREAEMARNVTARLLTEGDFLHPTAGVTFYIREIDPDGTLRDVFLSDRRDETRETTYTAAEAYLVRDGDRGNLIMVNGMAQRLDADTNSLSTTVFTDFSYDISALIKERDKGSRNIREIPTLELIRDRAGIAKTENYSEGQLAEELHLRFARALVCIAVALIGYSTLMLGSYSRFGVWRQVLAAFVLLILLEVMRGVVSEPVLKNPAMWPIIYLPTVTGLAVAALFMQVASRPVSALVPWRRTARRDRSGRGEPA